MAASIPMLGAGPILLAMALNFTVGALWYSPLLFGPAYERMASPRGKLRPHPLAMAVTVVSMLAHAPILCFLLAVVGVADANDGVLWGLLLAVLDTAMHINHPLFDGRPAGFSLCLVIQAQHTVYFILAGGLLGGVYGQGR
jgi:hypothetical protein